MHTIGIDFGTTKTLVSRIDSDTGKPVTIRLGQGTDYIPSAVYIADSGEMFFGDDADDRLADDNGEYLRGFKMQLGSSLPVYRHYENEATAIDYTARDLVSLFLRYIREKTQELAFMGEAVTRAIITRPVNFSPARCEELLLAALDAGFTEVHFTTEPEAAGLAFCKLNAAKAFHGSALIVDWGGGTLDFALVTRDTNGICTHSELTDGDMTMGGEHFDDLLWAYTAQILNDKGISDIKHTLALPHVRKGKEKLSTAPSTRLFLSSPSAGACPPIELTRPHLNELIEPDVAKAIAKIQRLLERIPEEKKPEMLLLVGGCSRIPFICQQLETACHLPAVAWEHSRTAVSLGAALWSPLSTAPSSISPTNTLQTMNTEQSDTTSASLTKEEAIAKLNKLFIKEKDYADALSRAMKAEDMEMAHTLIAAGAKLSDKANLKLLINAIQANDAKQVEFLIAAGADINNAADILGDAEFDEIIGCSGIIEFAAESANAHVVKTLLNAPGIDTEGWSPLALAVITDDLQATEQLLKAGYSPHAEGQGTSILNWAITRRNIDIISALIKAGAEQYYNLYNIASTATTDFIRQFLAIDGIDTGDWSPLTLAVISEDTATVQRLLQAGHSPNDNSSDNSSPLYWAVVKGNVEIAELLIKAGAKVNVDGYYNPLSQAAWHNSIEVAKLLIDAGAEVNGYGYDNPLSEAAKRNSVEVAKLLIDAGAEVNGYGDNPLSEAAERNSVEVAKLLIEAGAEINIDGYDNPLRIAAVYNSVEVAKLLIEAGAEVNKDDYWNPLSEAAEYNSVEVTKLLIEAGAEVNKDAHWNPLTKAASHNSVEVAKLLIEAGAEVNKDAHWNPLTEAAERNSVEVAKLLIDAGAEVNIEGKYRNPLSSTARGRNNVEVAKLLIDSGADVNKANLEEMLNDAARLANADMVKFILSQPEIDTDGWEPLSLAVIAEDEDKVRKLLAAGNSPDTISHELSCLAWAAERNNTAIAKLLIQNGADEDLTRALVKATSNDNAELVKFLIKAGADVNRIDEESGDSALHAAARHYRCCEAAKILIDAGADVDLNDDDGNTPLSVAVEEDHEEMVDLLIESGASDYDMALYKAEDNAEMLERLIDAGALKDDEKLGVRILTEAAESDYLEAAKVLIDAGVNVNMCDDYCNGETPLTIAATENHIEMAELLIEAGADVNMKNTKNLTPLKCAQKKGHTEMAELLIKEGAKKGGFFSR